MKLVFTAILSCLTVLSAFGQFKLDSIIDQNLTFKTKYKTTYLYNDDGNPTYIETHEYETYEIQYDAEQRIEKVITRDYITNNLKQTEIVVRDMKGKKDSINLFDATGFMHTSDIYSYKDGKVSEIRTHHFYNDTVNTKEHITFKYNDKGMIETHAVKYGIIFVAKFSYFYDEMGRIVKVYGKNEDYDFNYKGDELIGFKINESSKYKVFRNPDVSKDMYINPKVYYAYVNNKYGGLYWADVINKLVYDGRQPTKIVSEDENKIVTYHYSALVPNTNTQIHGQWLEVYPNPTTDILHLGNNKQIETLRIYNMTGQLVEEFNGKLKTISIGHLPNQIYLISAIDKEGNTYVSKIVKSN